MSIWELREVKKALKKDKYQQIDEDLIFSAFGKMKKIVEEAVLKTTKARRDLQKRNQTKSRKKSTRQDDKETLSQTIPFEIDDLEPYEDIDEDF